LSESKLYHVCWVSRVKVEVMPYYWWGCFPYQNRVVFRVIEIVCVKLIVRVEVILYTVGSTKSKLKQCCIIGEGAFHFRVEWLIQLRKLSELKLYSIHWVSQVKVEVMPYYWWGCFLYQTRVVFRVWVIIRVKVIVTVLLYTLGLSCQSQSHIGLSHVQSKFYRFHKIELILYHLVKFQ
jgi:hypothetical protein